MSSKAKNTKALQAKETAMLAGSQKYTLQLLGAGNEENVQQFIKQHAFKDKVHYYRTSNAGKDWFVVVYGEYPNKNAAKAALATIPQTLKAKGVQPWVRELQVAEQENIRKKRNG